VRRFRRPVVAVVASRAAGGQSVVVVVVGRSVFRSAFTSLAGIVRLPPGNAGRLVAADAGRQVQPVRPRAVRGKVGGRQAGQLAGLADLDGAAFSVAVLNPGIGEVVLLPNRIWNRNDVARSG